MAIQTVLARAAHVMRTGVDARKRVVNEFPVRTRPGEVRVTDRAEYRELLNTRMKLLLRARFIPEEKLGYRSTMALVEMREEFDDALRTAIDYGIIDPDTAFSWSTLANGPSFKLPASEPDDADTGE
jgi:hypothetical protein